MADPLKPSPRIPLELLDRTLAHLQADGAAGTLSAFQQCYKGLYAIVTPHLYRELYLTQHSIVALLQLYTQVPVRDRYHLFKVLHHAKDKWNWDTYPSVVRLRAVMTCVKGIIVGDIEETEDLIELIDMCEKLLGPVADVTEQHFFPAMRNLVILSPFMQHLEEDDNRPSKLLNLICHLSHPEQVCVHLPTCPPRPRKSSSPPSSPPGPMRPRRAPWYHALDGLSYVDASQITLHNVTNHAIRRTAVLPFGVPGETVHITIHFVEPPAGHLQGSISRLRSLSGQPGQSRKMRISQIADPIREALRLAINPAGSPSTSEESEKVTQGDDFLAFYRYFYPLAGIIDVDPTDSEGLTDVEIMAEFADDVLNAVFAPDPRRDGHRGPTKQYIRDRLVFLQGREAERASPCWGHEQGYC